MLLRSVVPSMWICCLVACCQGCGEPVEHRNERLRMERIISLVREFEKHLENAESFGERDQYDDAIGQYTTAIDLYEVIVKEGGQRNIPRRRSWPRLNRG